MRFRVRRILLVSSLYDSYILVEDGQINEAILREFLEFNISEKPDVTRVSTGREALRLAGEERRFDLIITSLQLDDMDAAEFSRRAREAGVEIPVLLLAYDNRRLTDFLAARQEERLGRVFLFQGDVRILLAMVKSVEDQRNVAHDTGEMGVPVILVVEDNVRFYSSFLPAIYAEILKHTHGLISEGLNLSQKLLRSRARPRVLLCTSFEEAWENFRLYEEHVLGIISDIEFPRGGGLDKLAGVELAKRAREVRSDIPIVLQSSIPDNEKLARAQNALFLLKGSPVLLEQLREILLEHFGFGDFTFRTPDGSVVGRAHDLKSLVDLIGRVPAESLIYHGERNHFSFWLKARTEFTLAEQLRPQKVAEFADSEELRERLIASISDYRSERDRAVVADFRPERLEDSAIIRIGGGSLGGKARGLAFINRLLYESNVSARFPGQRIVVPEAVVLGTDIFESFLDRNQLRRFAIEATRNTDTLDRFLGAPFPDSVLRDLRVFLERVRVPLAVRSSGLLEDSANQPFAGIYRTFMLPNNDPDLDTRLVQLVAAIKHVYASTFSRDAKSFLRVTHYRLEEERMAVIVQRIVGAAHGPRFYPTLSGVARSQNFYPVPPQKAEDGIVAAALGMGRTVVEGGACVRFSPRDPRRPMGFGSIDEMLQHSQREFYALDLERSPGGLGQEGQELTRYGLAQAEQDGTLQDVGSTYVPDNDRVYDDVERQGVRLVTLAPMLAHGRFPLAEMLDAMLEIGGRGIGGPVEIEFAVNLAVRRGRKPEFGFLQLRPLAASAETEALEIGDVKSSQVLCRSSRVLGNGKVEGLLDLVVVDPAEFDRSNSRRTAEAVAELNEELVSEERPFLLIGVGRWGSSDPFLGIPVGWSQIHGARVIVEAGLRDLSVEPSQGSHFFQNLTSCNVGYFTVNPQAGRGYVDWDWLRAQPTVRRLDAARRIRLERPVTVKMDGRRGEGVVLKPAGDEGGEAA